MYSVEYKCTNIEIKVTTISIITVRLSMQKHQSTVNKSTKIHFPKLILYTTFINKILYNKNNELVKAIKMLLVVIKQTPKPNCHPKKHPLKNPSRGEIIIKANIFSIAKNLTMIIYVFKKAVNF